MKNTKAILVTPGTMKIIAADVPVPKEHEVLIKVEYVGICGSDVHGFESGPFIPPKDPNQEIGLGHECAGTVVAVGKGVTKFKPGDRVNIEPGVPCGHCRYCLEGKYNICPDVDFMATQPNYRGALAHYLCHPESFTYKLPDNMEDLLKLPGIGRKTANLVLGDIYGLPAIVCDTHCIRITNLLGLTTGKDPAKVEQQLRLLLPSDKSNDFCHRLVLFGREICIARRPQCNICPLNDICKSGMTK